MRSLLPFHPPASTALSLAALVLLLGCAHAPATASMPRHLIYLHGGIVQDQQTARPQHPRFGYYELEKIADAFRARGFVVSADIRPKAASLDESADRLVVQVRDLLQSGVPADHITIVGGSRGAHIALLASARLDEPALRFGLLGSCLSENLLRLIAVARGPRGRLLFVREASDDLTASCPSWKDQFRPEPGLVADEVVVDTGLGHGFLYRPLPQWLDPLVAWATSAEQGKAATPPAAAGER